MKTRPEPDHHLVVDLEATTSDDGSVPRDAMEPIEIGAVLVRAADGHVIQTFSTLARPALHPTLHSFCTTLTGITQADVDAAPPFPAAFSAFCAAMLEGRGRVRFASWGSFDRRVLAQACARHLVEDPLGEGWNLKHAFSRRQGHRARYGLAAALEMCGLTFEGTPHRALPDAINTARLLPWIIGPERLPKGAGRRSARVSPAAPRPTPSS